jgi:hypothetical protein
MGWKIWCSHPERGRFFSAPNHPDWLWCPTSLLFRGYQGCFPEVKPVGSEAKHLHQVLWLKMIGAIPPLPSPAFIEHTGTTLTPIS